MSTSDELSLDEILGEKKYGYHTLNNPLNVSRALFCMCRCNEKKDRSFSLFGASDSGIYYSKIMVDAIFKLPVGTTIVRPMNEYVNPDYGYPTVSRFMRVDQAILENILHSEKADITKDYLNNNCDCYPIPYHGNRNALHTTYNSKLGPKHKFGDTVYPNNIFSKNPYIKNDDGIYSDKYDLIFDSSDVITPDKKTINLKTSYSASALKNPSYSDPFSVSNKPNDPNSLSVPGKLVDSNSSSASKKTKKSKKKDNKSNETNNLNDSFSASDKPKESKTIHIQMYSDENSYGGEKISSRL